MNTSKRTLLVLDPFTNGHEAALKFIRQKGWKKPECDLVFCGNHNALLQKLAEGPAYAVVPVYNSTKGEIASVTNEVARLRNFGYQLDEVGKIDLRINHCLIAPSYVSSIDQLQHVLSKDEAMGQCDQWLKQHGLTQEKRSAEDSTGAAAKHVSLLRESSQKMIGAIAPRRAARGYRGLRILADKIQDDLKNTTTFLLLENKAEIQRLVVGIIGINGRFGQVLKAFFENLGLTVIGSDRKKPTELSNADVVKKADVVIFAATVKRTAGAIRDILKYTRKDQLLMDITSIKQPIIKEMLKGKAQVVGLHPMFAPSVTFDGQTIVVCPARLTDPRLKTWVVNLLAATGAKRKWSNAKAHDEYMVTVQVSPQSANMVNAMVITEMGVNVNESTDFTSPFYKLMFSLMGRFLSQDPELFFSIFTQNPATLKMLRKRVEIERKLIRIIKTKDSAEFARWFVQARKHFGPDAIRDANEMFLRLNATSKTIDGNNAVTLEFSAKDSKPGLLERILRVFRHKDVNLTTISSVAFDQNRHQISLTTEGSKSSENVRRALDTIERWKHPRIRVIA